MANANKVRSALKDFILKMKAMDAAIPEDLAEDALEMAEEVKDALADDEDVDILEVTRDECEESMEAKVEDAVVRALRKAGVIRDASTSALDELEEELKAKVKEDDDDDEEESIEVKAKDAQLRFIRQMKPVIAQVKDSRVRKRLTDSLVDMVHGGSKIADGQYSSILNATRKNVSDSMHTSTTDSDVDFGMQVAKKFNPHYKEG